MTKVEAKKFINKIEKQWAILFKEEEEKEFVYCHDCRWYSGMDWCYHTLNMKTVKSPVRPLSKPKKKCDKLNKNNDCKCHEKGNKILQT